MVRSDIQPNHCAILHAICNERDVPFLYFATSIGHWLPHVCTAYLFLSTVGLQMLETRESRSVEGLFKQFCDNNAAFNEAMKQQIELNVLVLYTVANFTSAEPTIIVTCEIITFISCRKSIKNCPFYLIKSFIIAMTC